MHLTFEGATIKQGITHDITLDLNLEMGGFFMGSLHIGQKGVFYSTLHKTLEESSKKDFFNHSKLCLIFYKQYFFAFSRQLQKNQSKSYPIADFGLHSWVSVRTKLYRCILEHTQ